MNPLGVAVIPKRSMGSLDALLPVLVSLNAKGIETFSIILNGEIDGMVESSAFHAESFRALSTYKRLGRSNGGGGRFGAALKLVKILMLLIVIRLRCRKVIFLTHMSYNERSEAMLLRLLRFFGDTYWFPANPVGETSEFVKRYADEAWNVAIEVGAKARPHPVLMVDRAMCYRESEIELMRPRFAEGTHFVTVGNPRFWPEWQAYLRENGPRLVEQEVRRLMPSAATDRIVTIVVPAPEYFWFDDEGECFQVVNEILDLLESSFRDVAVLVKTKPQHFHQFQRSLNLEGRNARLTTLGLSVLATKSCLAFGVQESSGIFDFLVLGVPVIEYGRYSQAWLKLCPDGSAYRRFPGVTHVRDGRALEGAVLDASEGRLSGCHLADLKEFLGETSTFHRWLTDQCKDVDPEIGKKIPSKEKLGNEY